MVALIVVGRRSTFANARQSGYPRSSEKRTETNPLRLSHLGSAGYVILEQNEPIEANPHSFSLIERKEDHFSRNMDETLSPIGAGNQNSNSKMTNEAGMSFEICKMIFDVLSIPKCGKVKGSS
jgi:hypothetical protein